MKTIINCAMSADGKIALPSGQQTRISNDEDIERVQLLRSSSDAILVGIGTVLADDPKLTVKERYASSGDRPVRIVLDSGCRIPEGAEALKGDARTIVVTSEACEKNVPGAEMLRLGNDLVDLHRLIDVLDDMGIGTLLVEGGATVIWSFLREGLADELSVFVGSLIIGGRGSPTMADGDGFVSLSDARRLRLIGLERLGDGALLRYEVIK